MKTLKEKVNNTDMFELHPIFNYDDVKEAVLEFKQKYKEKFVKDDYKELCLDITEIFGDFEK